VANQHDSAEVRDREAQALELRRNGASYPQIAERLGISVSTAWAAVNRVLKRTAQEAAGDVRKLELERLDQLQIAALTVLRRTHPVVQAGKVVYTGGGDGQPAVPLVDDGPTLAAIRALLDIQQRRARLLGLDAPTKVEAKVLTMDVMDARVQELEAELAALDQTSPNPVD
jgi:Homeodomain-like domain